jgi:hypothetical protein
MLGPRTRAAAKRAFLAEQAEHKDDDGNERESKRAKYHVRTRALSHSSARAAEALAAATFRISVVTMAGAAISIHDCTAADTILSVKQRVFAANPKLFVRRQRLMYCPGPHGMDPLADNETLGGAGVAQDGSAKIDVLLAELTAAENVELGTNLVEAAVFGDVDDAIAALADGADLEYTNFLGRTALYLAAAHGKTRVLRVLIDAGGNKEAKNQDDQTALYISAYFGRLKSLSLLIASGANIEARNGKGQTALMVACQYGYESCVDLLLKAGANKDAMDNDGQTAQNLIDRQVEFSTNKRTSLISLFGRGC